MKQYFDNSLLLERINERFEDIDAFCEKAELEPVKFLKRLAEDNLTASDIMQCVDALEIAPEDVDRYFFTRSDTANPPGRPKVEIKKTTTPPMNNRYYTISEAVALLHIHRQTLHDRLRKGTLKGKLIGRTWRIYRDELFDNSSYIYYFDCLDENFGEKYLTPSQIDEIENHKTHGDPLTEGQIITIARNLEATLYRYDQTQTHSVCVYDCMDI